MQGASFPDRHAPSAFGFLAEICADIAASRPSTAVPSPGTLAGLTTLIRRHRLGGLVLGRLAEAVRPVDPKLAADLAEEARRRSVAALQRTARLVAISTALTRAGVRHLAIKGPVLSEQLYGNVAARESKDLDLLVDPATVDQAAAALEAIGLDGTADPSSQVHDHWEGKHRLFVGGGIEVEVHTRLLDLDSQLPLAFADVWSRREEVTVGGATLATLSRTDLLLYLCAHGAAHLWFRLKWLEDIARIVAAGDPRAIAGALHIAEREGAGGMIVGALQLVDDIFGIVFADVAPIRSTRTSRALVRLSKEALAAPAELAWAPSIGWIVRKLPLQFGLGRGWRYRRDLIRSLMLAPREFDAQGLPRGWGWLRLPLRPAMLIRDRWMRRAALR